MKLRMLIVPVALAALLAACGGGGKTEDSRPPGEQTSEPSPTPDNGIAEGQVLRGQSLRSSNGKLEVAGTGSTTLDVTVREMRSDAPEPPRGWVFSGPAYEITALNAGEAVTRLTEPFELRFTTDEPLGTVMYLDGTAWAVVPSEIEAGVVVAETDHLSAFAVVRPSTTRAASQSPTTTSAVSPEVAAAALEDALKKWRNTAARATGTGGYAGGVMELPPPLESALGGAAAIGELYSGVYGGVNQGFVSAPGGTGTFALLIEPRLEFPASSSQAQRMLADYFPGATGQLFVRVTESPTMYTYQATNSSGFIVLGFIEHDGIALAFVSVGSGAYVGSAVDAKD